MRDVWHTIFAVRNFDRNAGPIFRPLVSLAWPRGALNASCLAYDSVVNQLAGRMGRGGIRIAGACVGMFVGPMLNSSESGMFQKL
jgi:hypothetical protein